MLGGVQYVGGGQFPITLGPTDLPAQMAWNAPRYNAEIAGNVEDMGRVSLSEEGAMAVFVPVAFLVVIAYMLEKRRLRVAASARAG